MAGGILVFGGAPKVGKSDFILSLLCHLAAGVPFLGFKPPRPLRIFYLQAEIMKPYLIERLRQIKIPDGIVEAALENLVITPQLKILLNENGVAAIIAVIKEKFPNDPPDIIVVDPIRNVFDGGPDDSGLGENDNNAMLFFLQRRVETLRDTISQDAGIILVHHTTILVLPVTVCFLSRCRDSRHRDDARFLIDVENKISFQTAKTSEASKFRFSAAEDLQDILNIANTKIEALEEQRQKTEQAHHAEADLFQIAVHDLRQPIQTLTLIRGSLANMLHDKAALLLVIQMDQALAAIIEMINALPDIHLERPEVLTAETSCQSSALEKILVSETLQIRQAANAAGNPIIFVVDDNDMVRQQIRGVLEKGGHVVEDYATCEDFLVAYSPGCNACLLIDAYLPGMGGFELLDILDHSERKIPFIMITGSSDIPVAVRAMKAGALDFIEKPIGHDELLTSVGHALERLKDERKLSAWRDNAALLVKSLTARQREVMDFVLAGHPSKNIAADLHISQRTVENHRAVIMKKLGARSVPALARLALAAAESLQYTSGA